MILLKVTDYTTYILLLFCICITYCKCHREKYNYDKKQQSSFSMNELQFHFFFKANVGIKFFYESISFEAKFKKLYFYNSENPSP